MESIVSATFATTNEWLNSCALPLAKSLQYFHPEVPFIIYGPNEIQRLRQQYSYADIGNIKAIIGKELSRIYSLVILFDADSIVTAKLDEVFQNDYDVAGVRNHSDHGSVHMETNLDLFQVQGLVSKAQYMNAGLIACRNARFFDEWDILNQRLIPPRFDLDQGSLNIVAYSGEFKVKMLDPPEVPYYYGVANSWGDRTSWDSWKTINLHDNLLSMKNKFGQEKYIKILHKAGSGRNCPPGNKFSSDLFKPEVYEFIRRISS